MQTLAKSSILNRLVLAWFLSMLGVAGASPLVHPMAMEVVCTAGDAVKTVVSGADGKPADTGRHGFDCPLCLATALPLPQACSRVETLQPLPHCLKLVVAAHIAALVGAPLPPRGPPLLA